MDWFLLPPATDSMILDVSKAAQGRFIGDPSFVYEYLEIHRQGDREEEAVVSGFVIIEKILKFQKNSRPGAYKCMGQ